MAGSTLRPAALRMPETDAERRTVLARLFARMDLSGDCWVWTGSRQDAGYGTVRVDGRTRYVHRIVYTLTIGDIPARWYVCHRCDNPGCGRPSHLFAGPPIANTRDMIAKGRDRKHSSPESFVRGERVGGARLTELDVRWIRAAYAAGVASQRILAARFGISQAAISDVTCRRSWEHVA